MFPAWSLVTQWYTSFIRRLVLGLFIRWAFEVLSNVLTLEIKLHVDLTRSLRSRYGLKETL